MILSTSILLLLGGALSSPELQEQPLLELAPKIGSSEPFTYGAQGLEFPVERSVLVMLPLPGATELTIECATDSIFLLSFMSEQMRSNQLWRYRRLDAGTTELHLDLRQTQGWSRTSRPVLRVDGHGHFTIRRLRARGAPEDEAQARAELDRAGLWMPDSVGHTTINTLTPVFYSVSRGIYLPTAVATAALVFFAVLFLVLRRKPGALPRAFAGASLAAVLVFNAHFLLVRFLPMLEPLRLSADERIRHNYSFAPELGELTARARTLLPLTARVGVISSSDDWFGAQSLCFNLAPRRCVYLRGAGPDHTGIAGVTHLRNDEIDAIITYDASDPLPAGFMPITSVSARSSIASRR